MPRRLSELREGPFAGRLQQQLRHLFETLSAKVTELVTVTEYRRARIDREDLQYASPQSIWCICAICVESSCCPWGPPAFGPRSLSRLWHWRPKSRLGDVSGRIDHMAIDPNRHRMFVAELGNNTVGVVDLKERKVIHVIRGLKEPQGVAYVPSSDMLYVANAGDGSVRIFRADNFEPAGPYRSGRGRRQYSGRCGEQSGFCRIWEWCAGGD